MKNLILPAVIGLLFMCGGFYFGMRLMPPLPKAPAAVAATQAPAPTDVPPPDAISLDALKKTSEGMMSLNEALRGREQAVALREQEVKQREAELDAERATLDASHEKFKELFREFQDRLQLVSQAQSDQLQKQADLYTSMGLDQAIDLIREMDDPGISRLFSVMDTKPLGKLIAGWKAKYPADTPRLLHDLDGMADVMPKEKIALSEPPDSTTAPAAASPDAAPAPDAPAADAPAPDGTLTAPAADPNAPAATPAASPDTAPPASTNDAQPLAPPADATPHKSSDSTSTASN